MSDITLSNRYYPKTFDDKAAVAHTALILVDMLNEFCSHD